MIKFRKFAAQLLALCLASTALVGCRNEGKLTEQLDTVKAAVEGAVALTSGEIMVYATQKTELDYPGVLETEIAETYVKFINDGELQYDFTESTKTVSSGEVRYYEATSEQGMTVVTRDGVVQPETDAPDIFAYFKADFDVTAVEDISLIEATDRTIYAIEMTDAFEDTLDTEINGAKFTCERMVYNYHILADGTLASCLAESSFSVEYGGKTQTVTGFTQATINK